MKSLLTWAVIPILVSLFLGSVLNKLYLNEVSWQVLGGLLLSLYLVAILIVKNKTLRTKKLIHVITWIGLLGTWVGTGYLWKGMFGGIIVGVCILGICIVSLVLYQVTLKRKTAETEKKDTTPKVGYTQTQNQEGTRTERFSLNARIPHPKDPNKQGEIDTEDLFYQSGARLRVEEQMANAQLVKEVTEGMSRINMMYRREEIDSYTRNRMIKHLQSLLLGNDPTEEFMEEEGPENIEDTEDTEEEQPTVPTYQNKYSTFRQRQKFGKR